MINYSIMKISNGEHKEIHKNFKLNLNKYRPDTSTLYFDVEGEDIPFLMDFDLFFNIMNEQIQSGLLEKLDYNDGVISIVIRDGNIIKNYTYDFNFSAFEEYTMNNSSFDHLKRVLFKIVSLYKENPNSSLSSEQKYVWFIYDIIDGDRVSIVDDSNELLRIFEVYNSHKAEFLETLLNNVVFYDNDGNILDYRDRLRERKLEFIRYDVYNQMEAAILSFAQQCDAVQLYQNYLESIFIPRREIVYKQVDEFGNLVDVTPEVESGTIFSLGKELVEQGFSCLKNIASDGKKKLLKKNIT